ncbi:MAG: hypothetical protein ACO1N7_05390 [Sphingobacteriaceae bacterium]
MIIFQPEDQFPASSVKNIPEIIVYDNSNIQKTCSGVTTPLTYHLTKRIYATVFKQTLKKLSVSNKELLKNDDIFQNLIGLLKGRIYYNINNWYRGLQHFNSFNHNNISLSQIMGLSEPVTFADYDTKSWWQKCVLIWGRFIDFPRLIIAFSSLKGRLPQFFARMQKYTSEFHSLDLEKMSVAELKKEKAKLDKSIISNWDVPVINDLYVLMASGNVAEKLERAGLNNPQEFVNSFLKEEQGRANLLPAQQLHGLALKASYYPELKLLINRLPDDIHEQIRVRFNEFYSEVIQFLDKYGDKTAGGLKLETPTMRSNPLVFYGYLRDCLNAQISEIRAGNQFKQIALKTVEQKLSHVPVLRKKRVIGKIVKLQLAITNRELFKLEQSRVLGMYRALYNAFGNAFHQAGWIKYSSDIFYLTEEEILSCDNGREYIFDTLVATRKLEFETYKSEALPQRVFVSPTIVNPVVKQAPAVPIFDAANAEVA